VSWLLGAPWTTPSATCWPRRRDPCPRRRSPLDDGRHASSGRPRAGSSVRPGARELLEAVAAAGLPYALVTGSQRPSPRRSLASTALGFPVTVTGDDVARTKPDPEPYLLAAKLLDVDPSQLRGPGGFPNGVTSATAAGCHVIAVPSLLPSASPQATGSPLPKRHITSDPAGPGCLRATSASLTLTLTLALKTLISGLTLTLSWVPAPVHPPGRLERSEHSRDMSRWREHLGGAQK